VVDDKMRDTLTAARASATPDPALIRDFASAHVALAPEPLQRLDTEGRASGVQPQLSASGAQPAAPPQVPSGFGPLRQGLSHAAARPQRYFISGRS